MEPTNPSSDDIHIVVDTHYLDTQSDPANNRYVFSYTITIRNQGAAAAKLLARHWIITDANGKIDEVRGKGVVGEQPYLKPGQEFRYTSGAIIETPVGSMHGSYEMVRDNGAHFDARIAPFSLAVRNRLH
jgi:ApaG protein